MIDLTGQRFGRWTVQEYVGVRKNNYYWSCVCDCGNIARVHSGNLKGGHSQSCGCARKETLVELMSTHSRSKTKTYRIWSTMKDRCLNPKCKRYSLYGGLGIGVCSRWYKFENFLEDMGECPVGLTLERKDNNGNYSPENCIWATWTTQNNNKRNNKNYTFEGKTLTIKQWSEVTGINKKTLGSRILLYHWSIERTLTTPVMGHKYSRDKENERYT